MADPLDLAYAAGIVDGEGYIGITVNKRSIHCKVMVGMTDPEVPAWLMETFGGGLSFYPPRSSGGAKRGLHQWRVTGAKAEEFCRLLRPYLKVKHRQAELVLRFREDARLTFGARRGRIPDEELALKLAYAADIRALNQRVVPAEGGGLV